MADLSKFTYDQLRSLGSRYRIARYSRLSKAELIRQLEATGEFSDSGYTTIFEKIKAKTAGKPKTRAWYQQNLSQEIEEIAGDTSMFDQEQGDQGARVDKNRIIPPIPDNLTFFRYRAKTARNLPYYDRYPLCYILSVGNGFFYGINLHYFSPTSRIGIAIELKEKQIPKLPKGVHKYLISELRSPILGLSQEEWDTASLLPVEEFVRNLGGVEIPIKPTTVYRN
jgi:hypothetical protein